MSRLKFKTIKIISCVLCKKELGTKRNPPFWATFSWISATGCLHSPPTHHHAVSKKTFIFCPHDTSFYPFLQKVMITQNVCNFGTEDTLYNVYMTTLACNIYYNTCI